MGLTSEQVHWLYGGVLVVFAILALLRRRAVLRSRWPDFLIGIALFVVGVALILDPLLHGSAVPGNYGMETAQHLALGLLLVLASGLELYRTATRRRAFVWRLPLVFALVAAALLFALHAQHDAEAPMLLLVTQHRVIAATLFVLALAVLIAPAEADRERSLASSLLMLLLGLEFLIYTEGRSPFGVPDEAHAMHAGPAHETH